MFQKWNETAEYLLKSEVEGELGIFVSSFDETHENIDKLENDDASFKYFAKEEDKEQWNCFFRNDDDNDTQIPNCI